MSEKNSVVAERQAPLRRTYKEDKGKAVTVKRVRTVEKPTTDEWHGTVVAIDFPGVSWNYGIDAKVGGFDDLPNPGHILCVALAGCMDSTVRMLANHLGVAIEHLEVEVTGDVDVRGCLSMEPAVRPGFQQLRCDIRLETAPGADQRHVALLLQQTERLCVTLETLRNGVDIEVTSETTVPTAAAV